MVRNNTGDDVGRIEVAGTARDEAGAIVESGSSQGFQPAIVAPGGIAYGYVYFDSELAGSTFDFAFTVDAEEVDDYFKPVVVSEINNSGDKLNGAVTNNTESEISGPISVGVICFDADGTFRVDTALGSYVKPDDLPAGAAGSFSIDGYGTTCPVGLVAASGYSR